ncbi:MAG: class I adenylate-forming enzyme family protein [Gammaproteobacteria bacterium]
MHAADLLSRRATLTPEREALVELATGHRYSYAELNGRANRLANLLHGRFGVEKGDRVSVLAHNSVAYLDLLYGLAKIGAILTPLNWRLVSRELTYIVEDCRPKVLMVGPEFVQVAEELADKASIEHLIGLEGAQLEGSIAYEVALEQAADSEPLRPALDAETPYCILYTSGTTGPPKGAVIPHRQVLWNCINTVASWGLSETDVSPVFTPLFHAGGLFAFLTPLLYLGGRIVMARGFDAEASLEAIERERCTVILGVPTLFQMWLNASAFSKVDVRHVRWFISGGASCPTPLMQAWREAKQVVFRQGYGLTEVGPNCFSMTDEDAVRKAGSVGKPIFHSAMRIVDGDGHEVPTGEVGELTISGPHVCSGYWGKPEESGKALHQGWFFTGDMARADGDGFFYIVGRFKDMIISGGENIYAAEVEAAFLDHPAVAEAALIGEPDEKFGEIGVLVVVLRKDQSATASELLEFCQSHLARYKIPRRIVFTDELPYSPYGKVQKSILRERFGRSSSAG